MIKKDSDKSENILNRGVDQIIVKDDLRKKLLSGKKIRLYFGIDPTGALLHLGHAVILWKLKEFCDLGHEVILLIGDFTAKIGDPSGKNTIRVPLTNSEIKANMKDYKKQASKILDFSKVKIKYNSEWLSNLKFDDILKLFSHFTLKQMEQRDMFQERIKEKKPISLHEFMYPLMQGYDSVAMNVDLEIAGNDQLFNMLVGRNLQKIYNKKNKDVLAMKLLLGIDGRKMSKTYNNAIYLTDEPDDMYGKIMSIKDELIKDYFELCTNLPMEKIKEIKKRPNPRDQKAILAKEIIKMYYGQKEAEMAEEEFNKTFRDKKLPSGIKVFKTNKKVYPILDLLFDSGLTESKSEAKRVVEGGGVSVRIMNQESRIKDWKEKIKIEDGMAIQFGKRKFIKIKLL